MKKCKVERCNKKHHAFGYCSMHYSRWCRHSDLGTVEAYRVKNIGKCIIENCENPQYVKNLCNRHYLKLKRWGNPNCPNKLSLPGNKSPSWKGGKNKSSHGYILIYKPTHPFAYNNRYVFEHRLKMEKKLKRYLQPQEIVHHKNGVLDDNRIENLQLIKNTGFHCHLHKKLNFKNATR